MKTKLTITLELTETVEDCVRDGFSEILRDIADLVEIGFDEGNANGLGYWEITK